MLTYNVKLIFENDDEKWRYWATLESQRLAYNECSKVQFKQETRNIVNLHAKFYKKFRRKYPESKADIVIAAENECLSAYRSLKSKNYILTKPIYKERLSIRLNANTCTLKIQEKLINLNALAGRRIKARFETYSKIDELILKYPIADPLIFIKNNEIWLALSFKNPEIIIQPKKAVGVDFGLNRPATLSNGKIIKCESFNARKRRLRHVKSQLKSKGTKSAKRHLKKLRRKEFHINNNFNHHLTNEILKTDANILVLEDLTGIKRQTKNKYRTKFNNKLGQVPFSRLRQILTYKAQLHNKRVEVINPSYTSQIDSRTGKKDGVRQGARYYCKDKTVLDSDLNAANNIVKRCKLPVSCQIVTSLALDGQAVVTRLNVSGKPLANPRIYS